LGRVVNKTAFLKNTSLWHSVGGIALAGLMMLAPLASAAPPAPNDKPGVNNTAEQALTNAKKVYDTYVKKNKVTADEAKRTAFASCYVGCRNGDQAKTMESCAKQCGPELFAGTK
jgi:hypothetical protein